MCPTPFRSRLVPISISTGSSRAICSAPARPATPPFAPGRHAGWRRCPAFNPRTRTPRAARLDPAREAERMEQRWRAFKQANERRAQCLLADAQFFVAREHGFDNWPKFSAHVATLAHPHSEVAIFEAAVDAVVAGDAATLRRLLRDHPRLVTARSTREHRSTLLHYVSANGVEDFRQQTPPNIVEIARILLRGRRRRQRHLRGVRRGLDRIGTRGDEPSPAARRRADRAARHASGEWRESRTGRGKRRRLRGHRLPGEWPSRGGQLPREPRRRLDSRRGRGDWAPRRRPDVFRRWRFTRRSAQREGGLPGAGRRRRR